MVVCWAAEDEVELASRVFAALPPCASALRVLQPAGEEESSSMTRVAHAVGVVDPGRAGRWGVELDACGLELTGERDQLGGVAGRGA